MASGDHALFDPSAPVSLKKSNARPEFWLSLDTFDHDRAKALVRRLDAEADRIFTAARQRLTLQKTPPLQAVDDGTIARLAELFRHRKLAADWAKRRGDKPMSREHWAALGDEIEMLEAELRDANAGGDCSAVEFDVDTFEACREAGINIVGSPDRAKRRTVGKHTLS